MNYPLLSGKGDDRVVIGYNDIVIKPSDDVYIYPMPVPPHAQEARYCPVVLEVTTLQLSVGADVCDHDIPPVNKNKINIITRQ